MSFSQNTTIYSIYSHLRLIIFLIFLGFFFLCWFGCLVPYLSGFISFELGLLLFFILACTRLRVYTVMNVGRSSNSGYSLLGGLRALAQTIPYKIRLASFCLLLLLWFVDIIWLTFIQVYLWLIFLSLPLSLFDLFLVRLRLIILLILYIQYIHIIEYTVML